MKMDSFLRLPREVAKKTELTPTAKLVLMALHGHAWKEEVQSWPSVATIAEEVGVADTSVRNAIGLLVEHKLIAVEHRRDPKNPRRNLPNLYTLKEWSTPESAPGVVQNLEKGTPKSEPPSSNSCTRGTPKSGEDIEASRTDSLKEERIASSAQSETEEDEYDYIQDYLNAIYQSQGRLIRQPKPEQSWRNYQR